MRKWFTLLYTIIALTVLCTCSNDNEPAPEPPQPTHYSKIVIAYMMAENSLASLSQSDLNEMQRGTADIPADCRLITFIDDTQAPRIYEYSRQGRRTLYTFDSDICSTDSAQVDNILAGIISRYPADSYGLILWSHGYNWMPQHETLPLAQAPRRRTIGIDNEQNNLSNKGKELNISTLKHILEHHPKMEFIYFDACFMQGIETAYELKEATDCLMGSPAETPGRGAPYDAIMADLFARPVQPEILLNKVYETYRNYGGILLSAIRCSELEALAATTQRLALPLFEGRTELSTTGVQAYSAYCYGTHYRPEFFDMDSFLFKHLEPDAYNAWRTQFDRTVFVRKATRYWTSAIAPLYFTPEIISMEHYGGMSMYVPAEKYDAQGWNDDFRHTDWYRDAGWALTGW